MPGLPRRLKQPMAGGDALAHELLGLLLREVCQGLVRAQVALDDVDHARIRQQVVDDALERDEGAREHGDAAGELDAVPSCHGHERVDETTDVEVGEVGSPVVGDDRVELAQKVRVVDLRGVAHREAQQPVRQPGRVATGDRHDHIRHAASVARVEPAHDAEVHVDDLSAGDDEVSGVRIGVEKTVVEHLRRVVVHELLADLGAVVALRRELGGVVDGDAVDVVHHDDMPRAQRRVGLRALKVHAAGVVAAELLEVSGLDEKVGLLAEGLPQLVDDALQVEELIRSYEPAEAPGQRAHDRDVLGHDLLDMGTLDLDGDELSGDEACLVDLRHGGGAERMVVDGVENVLYRLVVLGAKGGEHRLAVHRLDVGAQLGELARKALGQDL